MYVYVHDYMCVVDTKGWSSMLVIYVDLVIYAPVIDDQWLGV